MVRIPNSEVLGGKGGGEGWGEDGGSKPQAEFNADSVFQLFQVDQMSTKHSWEHFG